MVYGGIGRTEWAVVYGGIGRWVVYRECRRRRGTGDVGDDRDRPAIGGWGYKGIRGGIQGGGGGVEEQRKGGPVFVLENTQTRIL